MTFRSPQVILFSNDVPRAVTFYSGLGITETFRVPTDAEPIHVDLELDGCRIGIASVASTRDDHGLDPIGEGQRAAVIRWTGDTPAAYVKLTEGGAPALAAPPCVAGPAADRVDRRPGRKPPPDRPVAR